MSVLDWIAVGFKIEKFECRKQNERFAIFWLVVKYVNLNEKYR